MNNASPFIFVGTEWDLVLRIHLRGTYLVCAAVGSEMARRGQGAIVNIASLSGMRPGPLHAYGPAKPASST